jgi:drug/metabolite transporter (DMT)-like permease
MLTQTSTKPRSLLLGIPNTDLAMLLVVLIWGVNFSVVKIALAEFPPLAFASLRFAVAGGLLWLIMRWREGPQAMDRPTWWKMIWVGIVGNTLYQICFNLGLSITTAANGSLLISTTPALVAASGAILGIEQLRRNTLVGIGLAIGGVALVLTARGLAFSLESISGDLLMLGCSIFWTIYTLGVRTLGSGLSPLRITTMTMLTGVPGLLLLSTPDLLRVDWPGISIGAWACFAYATVLAIVLAYLLWNNSVRVAGSNRTAIYGCVIPLVAALVAWPLLQEQPTVLQAVGAVLIISGVLLTRK